MSGAALTVSVPIAEIPSTGRSYRVEADEAQRIALASDLGITSIESLVAELEVRPAAGQAFTVRGSVGAAVVQTDVVTLDPVTLDIAEPVDVMLMPADAGQVRPKDRAIFAEAAEEAGPDVYRDGRIDLGAIVVEHLALGLDPYPRAPGAEFGGYVEDDPAGDASPFAALSTLKGGGT